MPNLAAAIPWILVSYGAYKGAETIGRGYQAQKMAEKDAAEIETRAREEEEEFREQGETFKSRQRTIVGSSAALATEGAPLDIMEETAQRIEEDALKIRKYGEQQAERIREEGRRYVRQGYSEALSYLAGMGETFLTNPDWFKVKKKKTTQTYEPWYFDPYMGWSF